MMKKVCILFMVFMMAISINLTAIAEDEPAPDFSTVGLEELMKVYEAAQQELLSRLNTGDTDSSIARGQYIVGKDINPGMYDFICGSAIVEGEYEFASISFYRITDSQNFENSRIIVL